jgi:hypothetical protein
VPTTTQATSYGYTSTFTGLLTVDEANSWYDDLKVAIDGQTSFGQVIDLRGQTAQNPDTNQIVQDAMAYVIAQGMQRSAVVLSSVVMRMQIMRLAKEAGMYAYERYFAVDSGVEWPPEVLAWVVDGVDPDTGDGE